MYCPNLSPPEVSMLYISPPPPPLVPSHVLCPYQILHFTLRAVSVKRVHIINSDITGTQKSPHSFEDNLEGGYR